MIIYIAGKYGAPTDGERLKNTNKAIDMGIAVYKKGHYPLVYCYGHIYCLVSIF